MALPLYALGARGTKPVFFPGLTAAQVEAATPIPGVWLVPGGLSCSWDAAAAVAAAVNRAVPPAPSFQIGMPGLARYRERKLHELARPYQKIGAAFVAMRAESMLCHTMRAGKCLMFTAASILVDAKRTLVITPALVRLTWQSEILKWAGQPVVILEGRGACEAKFVCMTCSGKARLADESWCPDCRAANGSSYGYRKYAPVYPEEWSGTTKSEGKRASRFELLPDDQQRSVYAEVQRRRAAVREQIRAEILRLPYCYAIISYDLFLAQRATDLRGRGIIREDLPGWGPFLSTITWDMAACDESHRLRGFGTDENRRGQSRRERVRDALAGVPQVCLITATPIFSYARDLWGQLDVLTNGGWGKTPFATHVRYCLPGDAPVWMADLSHKPISQVRVGDQVWGWSSANGRRRKFAPTTVREVFTVPAQSIVTVRMESGRTVTCTPDHLWATPIKHHGPYEPATTGPATIVRDTVTGRVLPCRAVLAYVTNADPMPAETQEYRRGYLHGLCDGDGTISHRWNLRPGSSSAERVRKVDIRLKDREPIDRAARFAADLSVPCTVRVGKTLREFTSSGVEALAFFYANREGGDEYWRGWLGGIYDAEGWGNVIAQYPTVNPETYANIVDALRRFGFETREDPEVVRFLGGREAFLRFWCLVQPAIRRKLASVNLNSSTVDGLWSQWTHDPVVSIEPAGIADVYCIRTDTGNFVAYGYGSKNCDGGSGKGYGNTWYKNGLSNVPELQSRLFPHIMIKPSREEILPDMPPLVREIVHLDEADIPALPGGIEVVRASDELDDEGEKKNTVKRALADAGYVKIPAVVESVLAEMVEGGKCIIFTKHVGVAQATYDVFGHVFKGREYGSVLRAQNAKVWLASGSKSPDARAKAASAFVEHQGAAVFVATIDAFQVGVSLFGARSVHFVELHYDPMAISQAEARPYDPRITRGLHVRFYVLRDSGDEAVEEIVLRKYVQVAAVTRDETAAQTTEAFRGEANPKAVANTMLAIYARMMKRIEDEM